MTWEKGREVIDELLSRQHLERVPANPEEAAYLLDRARQHLATAEREANDDLRSPMTPCTPPHADRLLRCSANKA